MATQTDESIDVGPRLTPLVEKASKILTEVLGPSREIVHREWRSASNDRGRTFVELTLSDWSGSVSTRFTPDELRDTPRLERRLIRLVGDLLQIRSHKLLDRLKEDIQGLAEE
jgi:hypothetical protein